MCNLGDIAVPTTGFIELYAVPTGLAHNSLLAGPVFTVTSDEALASVTISPPALTVSAIPAFDLSFTWWNGRYEAIWGGQYYRRRFYPVLYSMPPRAVGLEPLQEPVTFTMTAAQNTPNNYRHWYCTNYFSAGETQTSTTRLATNGTRSCTQPGGVGTDISFPSPISRRGPGVWFGGKA